MSDKKLTAIIQIFRPELPFSAGVCVLLGILIALRRFPPLRESVLGFVSIILISGSAVVLNDVFDLEVDRINAPHRPLTSGLLSPAEAVGLTAAAIVLGLASAYAIGIPALILYAISCSFALTLSAAHFGLAILVGFVPFLMGWMQPAYLVMLSIMDALIVVFTIRLLKSDTPKDGRRAMRGMYLGALIGMLAFILSQMFQM